LADTYGLMSTWALVPQGEFMPKARSAALRALELDENLAEAHTSLALVAESYDYDWQTAEKEFKRAIQLDPSYATAHQWYAECLSWQGRFDEALAESERARQLDPLSIIIASDHAVILYHSRQYDRAIAQARARLRPSARRPAIRRLATAPRSLSIVRKAHRNLSSVHGNRLRITARRQQAALDFVNLLGLPVPQSRRIRENQGQLNKIDCKSLPSERG
jgi:Tfp pilus assembly protein PilF